MLASFLMGLVGGQRSMTPLAAVTTAAAMGALPDDRAMPDILRTPAVHRAALLLAAAELAGDKMKSAPDRIVPLGLAARLIMNALASGSLAPRGRFAEGAAIGALTAVAASYPGWLLRITAMEEHGQTPTGLIEDALVIGGALAILRGLNERDGGEAASADEGDSAPGARLAPARTAD